jgi:hypothetical protein
MINSGSGSGRNIDLIFSKTAISNYKYNAKSQRRRVAKFLRHSYETFLFLCVFAPSRLCVEKKLKESTYNRHNCKNDNDFQRLIDKRSS